MPERKILLVEDDAGIREGLRDVLESEGFEVLTAADGTRGLALGLTEDPDLIVLDVMMPGMDGFEVLAKLRADHVDSPVLLLTARSLERDRVKGLDLGADDYVVKPFGLAELLARIRRRLAAWDRERGLDESRTLRIGRVTVDFTARRVLADGAEIHFTAKEFDLLHYLASHEGQAVSRGELLDEVWADSNSGSRVIDMAVVGLRKKIEPDPAQPRYLVAVRGVGYRFSRRG